MRRIGARSSGAAEAACAGGRAGMVGRDVVMEVPLLQPAVGKVPRSYCPYVEVLIACDRYGVSFISLVGRHDGVGQMRGGARGWAVRRSWRAVTR